MPVSRDQFDADLTAYNTAVLNYIAAVTAFIALPPVIDLANEDAEVQASLTAVNTALGQIPHPGAS